MSRDDAEYQDAHLRFVVSTDRFLSEMAYRVSRYDVPSAMVCGFVCGKGHFGTEIFPIGVCVLWRDLHKIPVHVASHLCKGLVLRTESAARVRAETSYRQTTHSGDVSAQHEQGEIPLSAGRDGFAERLGGEAQSRAREKQPRRGRRDGQTRAQVQVPRSGER